MWVPLIMSPSVLYASCISLIAAEADPGIMMEDLNREAAEFRNAPVASPLSGYIL
jgi:hypothetical protein